MKLLIFIANALGVLSTSFELPMKLQRFQAATNFGVSRKELLKIYNYANKDNGNQTQFVYESQAKESYPTGTEARARNPEDPVTLPIGITYGSEYGLPKFRVTGTASSGTVFPVNFQYEEVNVDALINAGIFLCMKPGYYHFSASMSPASSRGKIGLEIIHNGRSTMYAR